LEIVVLGSSGAFRLPELACHCPNCEAARANPALRRTTMSLWVRGGASILLDAGPDLYHQALREGIERVDGIFITHEHRDHIVGLECLETLVRLGQKGQPVQVFGPASFVGRAPGQFDYLLRHNLASFTSLEPGVTHEFAGYRVTPFPVIHHAIATYGYRVELGGCSLVYVPDLKELPGGPVDVAPLPEEMLGADLLFVDASFDAGGWVGAGHITWQQAAALGARSGAGRTVLIHFSHRVDFAALRRATNERLLEGYDGQRFSL